MPPLTRLPMRLPMGQGPPCRTLGGLLAMCLGLSLMLFCLGKASFADPPEERVWTDSPDRLEIDRFGPQNEPFDPERYSDVFYVSIQKGSDQDGIGRREHPWKTLSHALAVVDSSNSQHRPAILVAEGTYSETPIRMIPKVDLYGGFAPETWERDISNHATILDGQLERRVVEGADEARLDGFHIVRGRTCEHGAGILCHRTSPQIFNNIIRNNQTCEPSGFVHDPSRRRHVGNDGGGIACVDGANPEIAQNLVCDNGTEVGQGGGIACLNDSCPKIVYNLLEGNRTGNKDTHDTRTSNGGGISCFVGCCPIISNNLIANNRAGGRSDGGGIYCEYDGSPEVTFNYILGNVSEDDGAGIEIMKGSFPQVDSNIIAGNRSNYPGGGGGVRLSDRGLGRITNNLIAANSRSGLVCSNAWMTLVNNTIVHNHGRGKTFGLFFENEHWEYLMPPVIRNNLIWSNDTSAEVLFGTFPSHAHMKIDQEANWSGDGESDGKSPKIDDTWRRGLVEELKSRPDRFTTEVRVQGEGLSDAGLVGRPVSFGSQWSVIVAVHGQGVEVWGEIEDATDYAVLPTYRLLAGSPCIDTGSAKESPQHDCEGDVRSIHGNPVDLGFDEFVETTR